MHLIRKILNCEGKGGMVLGEAVLCDFAFERRRSGFIRAFVDFIFISFRL